MSDEEDYDSEEDLDYVPQEENVSEEDNSGEEEDLSLLGSGDTTSGSRRKKQQKSKNNELGVRKRKGGIKLDGEETKDKDEKDEGSIQLAEEIAKEKVVKKEVQEKKKADDLWSSFMMDVKPIPKKSPACTVAPTCLESSTISTKVHINNENGCPSASANTEKKEEIKIPTKTMKITKIFDFAGEEVKITEEVSANSKEAQKELKKQEQLKSEETSSTVVSKPAGSVLANIGIKRPAGAGGLGSVLNKIGKKQKMSVLDKSKMDWNSFKKEEGIEEDLKIHNNSKEGYIERMKFLQRTDLRQFELEKNMRLSSSSRR